MAVETLRDIVRYGAEHYGTQAAYRYKVNKTIEERTYEDLNRDTQAVSRMVESLGMKGKHIALVGTTSYPWIICFFGITGGGSVAAPMDVQLPASMICDQLNRADVEMLIFDEIRADLVTAVKEQCPQITKLISMQGMLAEDPESGVLSLQKLLEENQGEYETALDPDQLCTLLFTSGTTGKSKGVMLSHRNLADNATALDMKIPSGTVLLTLLPINHVYCLTNDIIKGVYIGVISCINDSIMRVARNMKLFQPDIVLMVPMVMESIYKKLRDVDPSIPKELVAKEVFGGKLHTICSGGAYLDPDYVDRFAEYGITVLQGYGMTECSPVISTNVFWDNRKGSVGRLLPNCEAKIVDDEIWVKGSSVMMGYYKMPEETAETLEDGWLKTGDLGYVTEDGYVYITGRKKNLIILANGENVSPEELENELSRSDLVKEILVREKETVIEAEIYPDYEYAEKQGIKDVRAALQDMIDDFNKEMPVYKRIYSLVVRKEEFPKTAAKKIKRF
ncbi:MAG: AMP-dependent synthetase/ligase [Brotaphodocola sp.]